METPAAAGSTSAPPPAKRRRTADIQSDLWHFGFGKKAPNNKRSILLKDPKGGSYCRNGKETSWRCSSKSCRALVRRVKGDTEYKLYNNHSCQAKDGKRIHGPEDVPAIPTDIQARLGDSQQALADFVNGLNANGTQQQGTV